MPSEQMQMPVLGPAPRPSKRTERAARRDLRRLKASGALDDRAALAEAILIVARAADRAEHNRDTWAAAAAIRELRALYHQVGAAAETDELDELLRQLSAPVEPS